MKYVTLIAVVLTWMLPTPSLAQLDSSKHQQTKNNVELKTLVNVGLIVFPPLIETQNDGSCTGQAIEKIRKLLPSNEFTLNIFCAPATRIYRELEANNIDLTIHVKANNSLSENVTFSASPFVNLEIVMYENEDVNNTDISSIKNFEYQGIRKTLTQQGHTFIDQSTSSASITVFLRGRTRFLITYRRPFERYISKNSAMLLRKSLNTEFSHNVLATTPTFFVVNNRHPQAARLLQQINMGNL